MELQSLTGLIYVDIYNKKWSWREESNPRPPDYKSDALPTELRQLDVEVFTSEGAYDPQQM